MRLGVHALPPRRLPPGVRAQRSPGGIDYMLESWATEAERRWLMGGMHGPPPPVFARGGFVGGLGIPIIGEAGTAACYRRWRPPLTETTVRTMAEFEEKFGPVPIEEYGRMPVAVPKRRRLRLVCPGCGHRSWTREGFANHWVREHLQATVGRVVTWE